MILNHFKLSRTTTQNLSVAPLALLCGHSHAQGWIQYANLADRFAVNFPAEAVAIRAIRRREENGDTR